MSESIRWSHPVKPSSALKKNAFVQPLISAVPFGLKSKLHHQSSALVLMQCYEGIILYQQTSV
jgi:hypothetical protein